MATLFTSIKLRGIKLFKIKSLRGARELTLRAINNASNDPIFLFDNRLPRRCDRRGTAPG